MLMPYNSSEKFVLKYTVFYTISSLAKEGFLCIHFQNNMRVILFTLLLAAAAASENLNTLLLQLKRELSVR